MLRNKAALDYARRHPVPFTVVTRSGYKPALFHWTMGDKLREAARNRLKFLLFALPPRAGKSELVTRSFPSWYLGRYPGKEIIVGSYSASLATKFGRSNRNLVASPQYQKIFPKAGLSRELGTSASDWGLTNGSSFFATGVGGGATGLGADIFIIDDPIKNRQDADSALYRETLKDWFREVVLTRLSPSGVVVVVATRWHYDDLIGWILREFDQSQCHYVRLPAIQDVERTSLDPRDPGAPLWADRFSLERLEEIREELGPMSFNALYQQVPSIAEGAVLKLEWLRQDFELRELPRFDRIVQSWDTAFEKGSRNDYSVGTTWGAVGGDFYLVDIARGRWNFPELKKMISANWLKWNADIVLVEKAASGRDILHELARNTDVPVRAVKVESDKTRRADAVSGRFEAGRVHIPKAAPWLSDFLQELEQFPKGVHDDQVDSTTQAIRYLTRSAGAVAVAA